MSVLTVIERNGLFVVDSREVSEMVDKRHDHLLRDITGYYEILSKSTEPKIGVSDFFITSFYQDSTGRTRPCYLLTRKGCDMVANKMTGEKGVLFTAAYVTKFEEMENKLKPQSIEDLIIMQAQSVKELRAHVTQVEDKLTNVNYRIDSLDAINIEGDARQRLVKMVQKYAHDKGLAYNKGWHDFKKAFNLTYHTNLELLITNFEAKTGMKKVTTPQYLAAANRLEDGVRVADKMINKAS